MQPRLTRDPESIVSDLLRFAEMKSKDLASRESYDAVKDEARLYLAERKADDEAWSRIRASYRDL